MAVTYLINKAIKYTFSILYDYGPELGLPSLPLDPVALVDACRINMTESDRIYMINQVQLDLSYI